MPETAERESPFPKTREVAELLGVHPRTVRRLVASGQLAAIQLGGRGTGIRVPREALREWLSSRREGADAPRLSVRDAEAALLHAAEFADD